MNIQADLECGVGKRTDGLLNEKLKLMILSLKLLHPLLQLQAFGPNALKHQFTPV